MLVHTDMLLKKTQTSFIVIVLKSTQNSQWLVKSKVAALVNVVYRKKLKSINEDFDIASHQNKTKRLQPKKMDKRDTVQYIRKEKILTLTESIVTAEPRREARDAELARVILKMTQKGKAEL